MCVHIGACTIHNMHKVPKYINTHYNGSISLWVMKCCHHGKRWISAERDLASPATSQVQLPAN